MIVSMYLKSCKGCGTSYFVEKLGDVEFVDGEMTYGMCPYCSYPYRREICLEREKEDMIALYGEDHVF